MRRLLLIPGVLALLGGLALLVLHTVSPNSPELQQAGPLRGWVIRFQEQPEMIRWYWAGGGALASISGLLLLLYSQAGAASRQWVLEQEAAGKLTVSLDGLQRLADHVLAQVSGVESVESRIFVKRGRARFRCRLTVSPSSSLAELSAEARSRLAGALHHHINQPPQDTVIDLDTRVRIPSRGVRRIE